jgi:hypothetical protein
MSKWVDEKIQKAIEEGQFDNLPGMGQPLRGASGVAYEDPTWRLAHKIMKENEVVPAWIAERRDILENFEKSRARLVAAWQWVQTSRVQNSYQADQYWQRSVGAFRQEATALNKRIFDFNLSISMLSQHLLLIDVEREIRRIQRTGSQT